MTKQVQPTVVVTPKLYVLVGVPASGKSTWIYNQLWATNCKLVSSDRYVEAYAKWCNKTYSEVFEEYMPKALELMVDEVRYAQSQRMDIIWDQTSTTRAARRKKLTMLPEYDAIAIVFRTPDPEEHARRLASRPGKIIPQEVVEDMINRFEMPTEEEGFKEIWYV